MNKVVIGVGFLAAAVLGMVIVSRRAASPAVKADANAASWGWKIDGNGIMYRDVGGGARQYYA